MSQTETYKGAHPAQSWRKKSFEWARGTSATARVALGSGGTFFLDFPLTAHYGFNIHEGIQAFPQPVYIVNSESFWE